MGINPLPTSLRDECKKAAKIFNGFVDPRSGLDNIVPADILRSARGFAIFSVVKAGFLVSARGGSGVVLAKLPDGQWSAPSAIGTGGLGFGGQLGAEMTEFLIILNSKRAVESFMSAGSLSIGGNLSVAIGPLGRNAEGSGSLSSKGRLAAMYSYSKTKGLFGGVSLEGSMIVERSDCNRQAYGYNVTGKQLLSGQVEPPQFADSLITAIESRTGSEIPHDWVDDQDDRPDHQDYSFKSDFASSGSVTSRSRSATLPGFNRSASSSKDGPGKRRHTIGQSDWVNDFDNEPSESAQENPFVSPSEAQKTNSAARKRPAYRSPRWSQSSFMKFASRGPIDDEDEDARDFLPASRNERNDVSATSPGDDDFFESHREEEPVVSHSPFPKTTPVQERSVGLGTAVALYNFAGVEAGDLSFAKGDVITVLKRTEDDWWTGRLRLKEGVFPVTYCDVFDD